MNSSSDSISRQQLPEEEIENGQPCFPGFRFNPTEDELVGFYLHRRLHNNQTNFSHLIQDLDLYSHEAWDLPGLAAVGEAERERFFFVSFASRLHNDGRPNRITPMGFWKTTGTDRPLYNQTPDSHVLAWKKTLVFYKRRAPRGQKTDWIMNEYRINHSGNEEEKEDIRLCRVYKKKTLARSFDRRPTIHVDRPLHTGRPSTFEYKASASSSSHIETDSTQQQFTGLGQQSSDTMNEGAGMSYSSPQTEMDVELEELGYHNC